MQSAFVPAAKVHFCEGSGMSLNYNIRMYELLPSGELEALGGGPIDQYGGSCPNVGDTVARYQLLTESFKFYSVQRRMFIDSADGDEGWAILIRAVDSSPLMSAVAEEWIDETKFWRDVDEREKREEYEKAASTQGTPEWSRRQWEERAKHRPLHGLNGREIDVLRFMAKNRKRNTVDRIPRAGDKTMHKLARIGVVQAGEDNVRGMKQWRLTKEGRAELKRWDTWTKWKWTE
jgi:hypothetical protein